MEVSVPSWYRKFFNADILCNSIFSLNISLNSLLRMFNLKKRYKSCRYWLLIVPGRSENLFRVSVLDCSANSSACCSVSWLKIRLRCDCGNCSIVKKSEYLSLLQKNPDCRSMSIILFSLLVSFRIILITFDCCLSKG